MFCVGCVYGMVLATEITAPQWINMVLFGDATGTIPLVGRSTPHTSHYDRPVV